MTDTNNLIDCLQWLDVAVAELHDNCPQMTKDEIQDKLVDISSSITIALTRTNYVDKILKKFKTSVLTIESCLLDKDN